MSSDSYNPASMRGGYRGRATVDASCHTLRPTVLLAVAEYADDAVIVDVDVFCGVGVHGDGMVCTVT